MRVERNGVAVETVGVDGAVIVIYGRPGNLDVDDLRWLAFVALPTAITVVLSEASEKVQKSELGDGQIPGQLAID